MKKQNIVTGFILLGVLVLLFFLFVAGINYFSGGMEGVAAGGDKIAIVSVRGTILDAEDTVEQLKKYGEDATIKGIILRVDSPGGAVGPSQEIYTQVLKTRMSGKKVVASLGSVAASGGYYVAAATDRIIANPGTLTGSIGVIFQFANLEELMKKIGLKTVVIKSGQYKDVGSPMRPLREDERRLLQGVIDDVYEQFVQAVAKGRKLPIEKVKEVADGRIFTGRQAKELGLVDKLGSLQDAVEETARLAGISGKPRIVREREDRSWIFRLLGGVLGNEGWVRDVAGVGGTSGLQYLWRFP
ncbi:MAG: signal peptide peptidase SppA [Candidatus Tectomicrobia bacterium]|uniref:Signal peptide peptidase SppA n=1 Tax=Tectimicrobiota bacterium TaxID=2528274 RepID=A0A932GMK6_UNCTE|nr:signal peptide peptidase SppA [Candidatus Tectomicrobia bacterium]